MKAKVKTQQRWRDAILAQRISGLSIKDFCEQRELSRPSFFLWRKQLGLIEHGDNKRAAKGFIRITPPALNGPAVGLKAIIETPAGYRVDIGCIGKDDLKSVFEMLRAL